MKSIYKSVGIAILFWIFSLQLIAEEKEAGIEIGYGWSTRGDVSSAVEEAARNVKDQMEHEPEWVLLFSTVGYPLDTMVKEVHKAFPKAKVFGETSCLGVITNDGFHLGQVGSLALLGIWSPKLEFGVGTGTLEEFKTGEEMGRNAVLRAIRDAGKDTADTPQLILMVPCAIGSEEEILKGVDGVFGKGRVPVFGGAAADNAIQGDWRIFVNGEVYNNSVGVTLIYSELKLGYAFLSGFNPTEHEATITKAEGRIIYELDYRPAGSVYNEWLGGRLSKKLNEGGNILLDTNLDPLGEKLGTFSYLLIHPKEFHPDTKALEVFANVKEGTEVHLLSGNPEMLVERPALTCRLARANGKIPKDKVAGGILIYCAGTMLAIPEESRSEIAPKINEVLGGSPFIGGWTFGEQGYFPEGVNRHGNLMSSMIVFGVE